MTLLEDVRALLATAMPDYETFRSREGVIIIAVERHNHNSEQYTSQGPSARFVWIKGRMKTTGSQLRGAYISQCQPGELDDTTKMAVNLITSDGTALLDKVPLGDLPHDSDKLIACSAVLQGQATSPTKTELSMGDARFATEPSGAVLSPRRTPLQPVNRQVSLPLKESVDDREGLKAFEKLELEHSPTTLPLPENAEASSPSAKAGTGRAKGLSIIAEYAPREYDDPFATVGDDNDNAPIVHSEALRKLVQDADASPERLEAGVQAGMITLTHLQANLEGHEQLNDVRGFVDQIGAIQKDALKTRTVIGVVGNTGAGKSSVINALLDEERLVPTNCMRACTAVVTELSYNHSKSEKSRYRAEIVFIKPEEWEKELKILVNELFDENGHLVPERNSDSEAGVAYAKIRAVYHTYTNEMLSKATVQSLMNVPRVSNTLGGTRSIHETHADVFYRKLQQYVDSKEKDTGNVNKKAAKGVAKKAAKGTRNKPERAFECWPLIKVVKIYTKADALSTGAVIVDLPGVHDSNAARAAVAEGYLKQCSGLWIVAPINRAVDDKAAKSLLGDTFKRQLKYDGAYSAVTFICSKTDDISVAEAADTLKLPDLQLIETELTKLDDRRDELADEFDKTEAELSDHTAAIEDIENNIETWEKLSDRRWAGEAVFAPDFTSARKRKSEEALPGSNKRRRTTDSASDNNLKHVDLIAEPGSQQNQIIDLTDETDQPLSDEAITEKVSELRSLKRDARGRLFEIKQQLGRLKTDMHDIETHKKDLDARRSELCVAGRNQYSKGAIQQDFAAGVKELDQENAEEENPDTFNPDEMLRDYEEVARSLPVFCVSSRAYQRLSGRFQREAVVSGFARLEQTEIPQLQAHCKALTVAGRTTSCRRWLNTLQALLNSLDLWTSDDGSGPQLDGQQRDAEKSFLKRKIEELEKALDTAISDTLKDVRIALVELLFEKFEPAIATAASNAVSTASKWGGPRDEGGLHYMTYKATVRRQGVFSGTSGHQDFNTALFEPISKQLATAWERVFQRRIPTILKSFTKAGSKLLLQFHRVIEARCTEKNHARARIGMLANSVTSYQALLSGLASDVTTRINDEQREINREFVPVLVATMEPVYERCADESGRSSFKRMKEHMTQHVEQSKATMFNAACDKVESSLVSLLGDLREIMAAQADQVCSNVQRDYMTTIGGGATGANKEHCPMPREERRVRKTVDGSLGNCDAAFEHLMERSAEDLKAKESVAEDQDMDDAMFVEPEEFEDESSADEQSEEEQAMEATIASTAEGMTIAPAAE